MTFRSSPLFALLAAAVLGSFVLSCDLLGVSSGGGRGPSLPGAVLAASMAGNQPGLWLFDPESLERTRVVEAVAGHSPSGMVFSPNGQRLYLTWSIDRSTPEGMYQRVLARLDTRSWEITKRRMLPDSSFGSASLIYDSTRAQIIAYGRNDGVVEFYDAETLERNGTASLGNSQEIDVTVLAPERDVVYFESHSDAGHHVQVYDPNTGTIARRLHLTDDPTLQKSALSDLALSPNERYLYATTYLSPGGPGRFFMVDLETGEPVFEGPAGGYSNLAVHPNGRYVYVDCPAGGRWELVPTNQILRFDRKAREMEVFIDGGKALGLPYEGLIADKITMLPGGEAFVINNPSSTRTRRDEDDPKQPSLLQVDTKSGAVHATYFPSRDDKGQVLAGTQRLRSGVVPE